MSILLGTQQDMRPGRNIFLPVSGWNAESYLYFSSHSWASVNCWPTPKKHHFYLSVFSKNGPFSKISKKMNPFQLQSITSINIYWNVKFWNIHQTGNAKKDQLFSSKKCPHFEDILNGPDFDNLNENKQKNQTGPVSKGSSKLVHLRPRSVHYQKHKKTQTLYWGPIRGNFYETFKTFPKRFTLIATPHSII